MRKNLIWLVLVAFLTSSVAVGGGQRARRSSEDGQILEHVFARYQRTKTFKNWLAELSEQDREFFSTELGTGVNAPLPDCELKNRVFVLKTAQGRQEIVPIDVQAGTFRIFGKAYQHKAGTPLKIVYEELRRVLGPAEPGFSGLFIPEARAFAHIEVAIICGTIFLISSIVKAVTMRGLERLEKDLNTCIKRKESLELGLSSEKSEQVASQVVAELSEQTTKIFSECFDQAPPQGSADSPLKERECALRKALLSCAKDLKALLRNNAAVTDQKGSEKDETTHKGDPDTHAEKTASPAGDGS